MQHLVLLAWQAAVVIVLVLGLPDALTAVRVSGYFNDAQYVERW